jgi:hypothetical protein
VYVIVIINNLDSLHSPKTPNIEKNIQTMKPTFMDHKKLLSSCWTCSFGYNFDKILSVEEVHRRRRKTRECAVEAHLGGQCAEGGQCTDRGIKQRNKAENKVGEESGRKGRMTTNVLKIEGRDKSRKNNNQKKSSMQMKKGESSPNNQLTGVVMHCNRVLG